MPEIKPISSKPHFFFFQKEKVQVAQKEKGFSNCNFSEKELSGVCHHA